MSRGIWIGWGQNGCRGKVGYKWCNMTYHLGIHKDQISFHRSPNHVSSLIDIIEFQMIYASPSLIKPELLYCVQCTQSQSNFNYKYLYYMQKKKNSIYSNVIICFILSPFLTLPFQPLYLPLFSYRTLQPQMNHLWVCVCVQIWHFFYVSDRKYRFEINFCVFNYWLLSYCLATYFCLWTRSILFHFNRMYKGETFYIK